MSKRIPTIGKDTFRDLPNIDIVGQGPRGNGPNSLKPWILVGLVVAAYFVMKSKTL